MAKVIVSAAVFVGSVSVIACWFAIGLRWADEGSGSARKPLKALIQEVAVIVPEGARRELVSASLREILSGRHGEWWDTPFDPSWRVAAFDRADELGFFQSSWIQEVHYEDQASLLWLAVKWLEVGEEVSESALLKAYWRNALVPCRKSSCD